jgi:UDP-N-acetylmuramyl pentapeptide synthase
MAERYDGEVHVVPDAAAAAERVPELVQPGDVVLVKGSLAVGLEAVCRALSAPQTAGVPNGASA